MACFASLDVGFISDTLVRAHSISPMNKGWAAVIEKCGVEEASDVDGDILTLFHVVVSTGAVQSVSVICRTASR